MKNKIITLIVLSVFILSLPNIVSLENQNIGKQNNNFTINQVCNDATYITLSTIQYPDRTIITLNTNMTYVGGGSFQYNLTSTSQLGRYDFTGISDGCENTFASYFEVTPSGQYMDSGKGLTLIVSVIVMIIISLVFLFIANKSEKSMIGETSKLTMQHD